jgi:catechol 2,3-dioxygenase-like lactoylglutathione lyase family enzyme
MNERAAHVILKTLDMAETIRWYTTAGFQLRDRFPDIEPRWCEDPNGYYIMFAEDI